MGGERELLKVVEVDGKASIIINGEKMTEKQTKRDAFQSLKEVQEEIRNHMRGEKEDDSSTNETSPFGVQGGIPAGPIT